MSQHTPWTRPDDESGKSPGQYGPPPMASPPMAPEAPAWGQPPNQYSWAPQPPQASWQAFRPKPGVIPLRPITIGEIYDGAFQALRTNPRSMIGFSAIVLTVMSLLVLIPQALSMNSMLAGITSSSSSSSNLLDTNYVIGTYLVPGVVQFLAITILNSLLVVAVSAAVLGQRTSPSQLWAAVRPRLGAIFGLSLLVSLATGLGSMFCGALVIGAGIALGIWATWWAGVPVIVIGLVIWLVLALFLWTRWALTGPVLLLENRSVLASMRRGWQLIDGNAWRILGISLLTGILVSIGEGIISFPFSLLASIVLAVGGGSSTQLGFGYTLTYLVIVQIGATLAGAIFYPFTSAVTALLYVDVRMRREGLDVELIRASTPEAMA